MGWLFAVAAAVVVAAGVGYRRRMARVRGGGLSDDDIRRIEHHGRARVEEPLDLEEAAEEEERFWGESWDEPEPF